MDTIMTVKRRGAVDTDSPEQSTDAFVLHHPEAKYFNT
jgi:cobalamin-dependent methionine synthase I